MHLTRDLNAEETTALRGGFQLKETAAAEAWIQDCTWQAQGRGKARALAQRDEGGAWQVVALLGCGLQSPWS